MDNPNDLKQKVLKGSISLTLRQLLASALSLVSVFVIARTLGPALYGVVSASLGIFYFFRWTIRFGLGTYIVRQPDLKDEEVEQILYLYGLGGLLICVGLWLLAPAFSWWIGRSEITLLLRLLLPALWIDLIGSVSMSLLQRQLRFDLVSLVESVSMIVNYLLSVPIVLMYSSVLGPILGVVLQYVVATGLSIFFMPVKWRNRLSWKVLEAPVRYGISYYSSNCFFNLRELTVPLFVSRLAGIEAVGYTNITIRMAHQLLLLRKVIRRMSIGVMAKVVDNAAATRSALTQGMVYQALLMGAVCALFGSCATWLIPAVFGEKWLLSAQLFPLIGIATLVGAIFDLHSATLYAVAKNRDVSILNVAYIGSLWLACVVLIPPLGFWGYGVAELVALPSYFLVHRSVTKLFGSPDYSLAAWLVATSLPPLLAGIFLPPTVALVLFCLSYGLLFLTSNRARNTALKLVEAVQLKSA